MAQGEPARADVEALPGAVVLEFGASWCPICHAARPVIDAALAERPAVRRLWIEDGRGQPLGRSYGVKLWPTLIVLVDGREVARVVRPRDMAAVRDALAKADRARTGIST